MDAAALWKRYQDWLYYHEGLDIYVDISRMSFDDAFVKQLTPRFEQAFEAMAELEKAARSPTLMKIAWWATTGYAILS